MLLVILAIWFGYKKASETGRNGFVWAFICAAVFIGTQLICGLAIGMFLGVGVAFWGWSETVFDDYSVLISVVSVVISFIPLLLIFRYLDKIPEEKSFVPPPEPPKFN